MTREDLNYALKYEVLKARIASIQDETVINDLKILAWTGFSEIHFNSGEIVSVKTSEGKMLNRGMVVKVQSTYSGQGTGVIIGFNFGDSRYPITVSRGGAEGELVSCVRLEEIDFHNTQAVIGTPIRLEAYTKTSI